MRSRGLSTLRNNCYISASSIPDPNHDSLSPSLMNRAILVDLSSEPLAVLAQTNFPVPRSTINKTSTNFPRQACRHKQNQDLRSRTTTTRKPTTTTIPLKHKRLSAVMSAEELVQVLLFTALVEVRPLVDSLVSDEPPTQMSIVSFLSLPVFLLHADNHPQQWT